MGMETVELRIVIGTCSDSLGIDGNRLKDHILAAMSRFEHEEYKDEPHLWEVERIEFGYDWEFGHKVPSLLYDLSEEIEKDYQRMQAEGGNNVMVGETGLD